MNFSPEDNNISSSFNFGLNLEAELRLAQHKEQYQDFEVKANNEEFLEEELDPSYLSENEDDSLVIKIPELADELQELKLKEDSKRREMLENNNSINMKYNNFLVEKMEYLKSSIINIGSMMEYQNTTMDTINGQLTEMKSTLSDISKEREQHKIERENKNKELLQNTELDTTISSSKTSIKRIRESYNSLINKDIQAESIFKDDEDVDFIRICNVMDVMIKDAYNAVNSIPA